MISEHIVNILHMARLVLYAVGVKLARDYLFDLRLIATDWSIHFSNSTESSIISGGSSQ